MKKNKLLFNFRTVIIVLAHLLIYSKVNSQDIVFKNISLPGDSRSLITSISQDRQGNMWISNVYGMHRYDGINWKSYTHSRLDPTSLVNDRVESIHHDKNGNIWVGTLGFGLQKLDPVSEEFTNFKRDPNDINSISGDSITAIVQGPKGYIWIGTNFNGLNRLDPETGNVKRYQHQEKNSNSLSFNQVRTLYFDKEDKLWVGTGSNVYDENPLNKGGLNRFNSNTDDFTRYVHDSLNPNSLIDDRVRAIFEDSKGDFWIGTAGDGLHTMDRSSGKFKRHTYEPDNPEKLSRPAPVLQGSVGWGDDNITFITEDLESNIWIGTLENGMNRYDAISEKITHYSTNKNGGGDLTDTTTWCSFTSRDGIIWVGTVLGDLFKIDPSQHLIPHTSLSSDTPTAVWSFFENPGNYQYFGTTNGLLRKDLINNTSKLYRYDSTSTQSIGGNFVPSILQDSKKRIWVGTDGGLSLLDPDKQTFNTFRHDENDENSLINNVALCIYEDRQSDLWVGTDFGFDKIDVENKIFTHYKIFPEDSVTGRNVVFSILEDRHDNFWIGQVGRKKGLYKFDRKTETFENYISHEVWAIHEDQKGRLWVATDAALYTYDAKKDQFNPFLDPLTENSFASEDIVEDSEGNIWVPTTASIYRINEDVSRFGSSFGIRGNQFRPHRADITSDGQLIFGNFRGYYSLNPDEVNRYSKPPEINLIELKVSGRQIGENKRDEYDGKLMDVKEVNLDYDQNVFSLLFNVVHYSDPLANKSMYWLENYDEGWRTSGGNNEAYYYAVPPGQYVFHIKGSSSEGMWTEKSIVINIATPWWKTRWAFGIYVILLALMIFSFDRFMRARILQQERTKSQEKELAQAKEIEKAYHDLKSTQSQLIQSEKMASLGELTAGIAHEIQNPLNFVKNFSEVSTELIDEMVEDLKSGKQDEVLSLAEEIKENQERINHHGKRAGSIVRGMLQHSRSSSGEMVPTDLNKLCDEYLRLSYHGLRAKDKSFNADLQTDLAKDLPKIEVIPQDFGRVLLNLINNAFYAVKEKSETSGADFKPMVKVSTKLLKDHLEIKVSDNGNGIPDGVKDKIFQPFFTTKPTGKGTGLGLSLSYDIVKAHGGELAVDSEDGQGTVFKIDLPCT